MYFVSLLNAGDGPLIPGDGEYHIVPFPFGGGESADPHEMHQALQPDGATAAYPDDRSGLIWPAVEGWGLLDAMIQWEPGSYKELRAGFIRDPLGLSTGANSTGTNHWPPSPGMQCFTFVHSMLVSPGTPLALRVAHDDPVPRRITHAQFKLSIAHT